MIYRSSGVKADSENTGFGYREFARYDVGGYPETTAGSAAPPTAPVAKYLPRTLAAVARRAGRQPS